MAAQRTSAIETRVSSDDRPEAGAVGSGARPGGAVRVDDMGASL